MNGCISTDRILAKLDEHLHKNDYASAERHLLYWLGESSGAGDIRTELLIRNELMGLYRKLGRREKDYEFFAKFDAIDRFVNNIFIYIIRQYIKII